MILALLTNTVIAIAILAAAWFIGSWAQKAVGKVGKLDTTLRTFLGALAKYAIFVFAIVSVLNQFGIQTASLIAVLGAAGLAIGLALQGTLSNVAAGVMMLIIRPFNVGDFIEFNGQSGTVKELNLFGTELATLNNVYVYAPNSNIWNSDIYNFSRNTHRRQDLSFGISYSDDINKAFKTINAVLKKEERLLTTKDKEPMIAVENLGASSVDIKVRIWTKTADTLGVQMDLKKAIKEALDKDGLTIPFPTSTVEMHDMSAPKKATPKAAPKKKAA